MAVNESRKETPLYLERGNDESLMEEAFIHNLNQNSVSRVSPDTS